MLLILQISMYADLQALVAFFSKDRLLESVIPRIFACNESRVSVFPIRMETGCRFGREVLFGATRRCFLFYHHCLSLLAVIHIFTSEIQFCIH